MRLSVLRVAAVALALNFTVAAAIALDQNLPVYHPVATLSGHLKSVGSDTLGREIALWASAFEKLYPDVKIDIEAKGSATAPTALLDGTAQFGPMSRPMTATEAAAFEEKYGYRSQDSASRSMRWPSMSTSRINACLTIRKLARSSRQNAWLRAAPTSRNGVTLA